VLSYEGKWGRVHISRKGDQAHLHNYFCCRGRRESLRGHSANPSANCHLAQPARSSKEGLSPAAGARRRLRGNEASRTHPACAPWGTSFLRSPLIAPTASQPPEVQGRPRQTCEVMRRNLRAAGPVERVPSHAIGGSRRTGLQPRESTMQGPRATGPCTSRLPVGRVDRASRFADVGELAQGRHVDFLSPDRAVSSFARGATTIRGGSSLGAMAEPPENSRLDNRKLLEDAGRTGT
jgi:hypothetical protein